MMSEKVGPFAELRIVLERKNGEVVEGVCFRKGNEPVLGSEFVKFCFFDGERFNITYVRKDEIAVINFAEDKKDIYLSSEHIWLTMGGDWA